jgi:hypothetical protein
MAFLKLIEACQANGAVKRKWFVYSKAKVASTCLKHFVGKLEMFHSMHLLNIELHYCVDFSLEKKHW